MNYKIERYEKHGDKRGQLVVFLKKTELDKQSKTFGQIYFVTFNKKGVIRGNHYHKKWKEWFGIIAGKVTVYLTDVRTHKKVIIKLNAEGKQYVRLNIGPNIAHAIQSTSKYAALLNYANNEWSSSDTFEYIVKK